MRVFLSAGEPSGDVHGANLVRTLRRLRPDLECVGFGGERMQEAGCKLLYPLCQLAVMWFGRVLARAPTFLSLLSRADRYFRHQRPDAVVLIDYPGFNWWLARRAHFHGIPVFYFVPPQLWAWAGWRVGKMRRWVDHVLCNLPFERKWYQERGVEAHYVGHPYFDELPRQQLDPAFLTEQRAKGGTVIGLLPGSRTQELERNLSTQLKAAARIHQTIPEARFLVACFKSAHQEMVERCLKQHPALPVQSHVGRTPEIIELSRACIAVSGSVTLELLYRQKPSVIVYRVSKMLLRLARLLKTCRYITLVNLLAEKELFPEFPSERCESEAVARQVLRWLTEPEVYGKVCDELAELKSRVAEPGACERAAKLILNTLAPPLAA